MVICPRGSHHDVRRTTGTLVTCHDDTRNIILTDIVSILQHVVAHVRINQDCVADGIDDAEAELQHSPTAPSAEQLW